MIVKVTTACMGRDQFKRLFSLDCLTAHYKTVHNKIEMFGFGSGSNMIGVMIIVINCYMKVISMVVYIDYIHLKNEEYSGLLRPVAIVWELLVHIYVVTN